MGMSAWTVPTSQFLRQSKLTSPPRMKGVLAADDIDFTMDPDSADPDAEHSPRPVIHGGDFDAPSVRADAEVVNMTQQPENSDVDLYDDEVDDDPDFARALQTTLHGELGGDAISLRSVIAKFCQRDPTAMVLCIEGDGGRGRV